MRLYGSGTTTTPPLSLASSPGKRQREVETSQTAADIIGSSDSAVAKKTASEVRKASEAATQLRDGLPKPQDTVFQGVKIWSGRSADKVEGTSSMMPSISESPLEQDFTIEGMPSKLGCPFASMSKKKLSSHAASILSRYNNSVAGAPSSPSVISAPRIDGKESVEARKLSAKRESLPDPIKAEICGLSDHDDESPFSERVAHNHPPQTQHQEEPHPQQAQSQSANADVGVCPIRFLDQHSPEELATYFERHKHELPRSHETCVKRYQSNEQQIRELDAKYGNLVSMISGLGAKHKDMLPEEPADDDDAVADGDAPDVAKIQKWASSVSAMGAGQQPDDGEPDDRLPHFERPLRDVRVGESPSRPWGIAVPAKYVEAARSDTSSRPAQVKPEPATASKVVDQKPTKCPFGNSAKITAPQTTIPQAKAAAPVFFGPEAMHSGPSAKVGEASPEAAGRHPGMILSGPVFIGYSAEDAAKILRDSGFAGR